MPATIGHGPAPSTIIEGPDFIDSTARERRSTRLTHYSLFKDRAPEELRALTLPGN